MAKKQKFSDKMKVRTKKDITVKVIKSIKNSDGSGYKFSESWVKLEDIQKINEIK